MDDKDGPSVLHMEKTKKKVSSQVSRKKIWKGIQMIDRYVEMLKNCKLHQWKNAVCLPKRAKEKMKKFSRRKKTEKKKESGKIPPRHTDAQP